MAQRQRQPAGVGVMSACPKCGYVIQIIVSSVTPKQLECARFIHGFIEMRGFSPSYENIAAGLGLKSTSGVNRLVSALEQRGWLTRIPFQARTMKMLVVPPVQREAFYAGNIALTGGPDEIHEGTVDVFPSSGLKRGV